MWNNGSPTRTLGLNSMMSDVAKACKSKGIPLGDGIEDCDIESFLHRLLGALSALPMSFDDLLEELNIRRRDDGDDDVGPISADNPNIGTAPGSESSPMSMVLSWEGQPKRKRPRKEQLLYAEGRKRGRKAGRH